MVALGDEEMIIYNFKKGEINKTLYAASTIQQHARNLKNFSGGYTSILGAGDVIASSAEVLELMHCI